ncbi:MAG: hypothetical protein ACD_27C00007G0001 [uncultured bacterium]|nr:MAG: hypothetical protein ACD_27C00007G0001 [uncultured bacterium]
MSYRYIKAPPGYTLRRRPRALNFRLLFSSLLLTLGVTAFTSVAYPMLVYQLTFAPRFSTAAAANSSDTTTVLPEMVNTALDYTNSDAWFSPATRPDNSSRISYTLSIPRLNISSAVVRNDHTDLKESLIHYPGTAFPGDLGNGVIFGHSVLPQFFNPKNYLTIFSTLHLLEPGDEIEIVFGPATYTYQIKDIYETTPDDLSPLAQSYNNRVLTLITCTPPGTYLRRLIVKAVLL